MKKNNSEIQIKEETSKPIFFEKIKKHHALNTLSRKEIQEAFEYQKKNIGWDFYSEREFVENLFSQRFNYLIVMYSVFLTAAAASSSHKNLIIVLSLGVIMVFLVALTVFRAYKKLMVNLKILHKLDKYHVFPIIEKEIQTNGYKGLFGVNPIVGWVIPLFCTSTLFIGLICACLGVI